MSQPCAKLLAKQMQSLQKHKQSAQDEGSCGPPLLCEDRLHRAIWPSPEGPSRNTDHLEHSPAIHKWLSYSIKTRFSPGSSQPGAMVGEGRRYWILAQLKEPHVQLKITSVGEDVKKM